MTSYGELFKRAQIPDVKEPEGLLKHDVNLKT